MDDILDKLDDKNIELCKTIASAKDSIDVYRIISLNAKTINKMGGGKHFFGHLQNIEIKHLALELCKMFENEGRYELTSIPAILKYITNSTPPIKDTEALNTFASKYGNKADTVSRVYSLFLEQHQNYIDTIKEVRDKRIAHPEDIQKEGKLPSYDILETLLKFSIDFYSMISIAYIGVFPVNFEDRTQIAGSLVNLLRKMGMEKVKREFPQENKITPCRANSES